MSLGGLRPVFQHRSFTQARNLVEESSFARRSDFGFEFLDRH
jgi:hypothetical protein